MINKKFQIKLQQGTPLPAGITQLENGFNFSLFSRHAEKITLILESSDGTDPVPLRYELPLSSEVNRTGDMWHVFVETNRNDFRYGYRIEGASQSIENGLAYDAGLILIDPYSHSLLAKAWGSPERYGQVPCCLPPTSNFDWQNDHPLKRPLSETIIYEIHVRGFTQNLNSRVSAPGTFTGVIEKIPYLKDLGITAVELMPITLFDENDTVFHDPVTGEELKNFWGYNPISFFALQSGYAKTPENAVQEFKEMVRALHRAGIEVFLDMVYNHSGEGGYSGTTSSFRGIDNPIYYMLDDRNDYQNFSGCGNTMNCNHPVVRDLIRDSLRYWVTEMHIDGFRFDLASILGRDQQGNVLANPPMIEIIGQDPVLRDTKLIAEAWDAAGLYQVGSFSNDTRWAEWNGRFRDDVRAFMLSDRGTVTRLATRIAGSSDLYQPMGRSPLCSINFITSHDGFTLNDLVSYDQKNNLANGEGNLDGDNHNVSWNGGFEGEGAPEAIATQRLVRMKTFATLLFFSQGVPMFPGGDEFGRSQNGNNNAWCQDNETSWLDWSLLKTNHGLFRFFKGCIQLRKNHKVFRREDFFPPGSPEIEQSRTPDIIWQYLWPGEQNWSEDCHGLGFLLRGHKEQDSDFFIMINGERSLPLIFTPPDPIEPKTAWRQIIDTNRETPDDLTTYSEAVKIIRGGSIQVSPLSCAVLEGRIEKYPGRSRKAG